MTLEEENNLYMSFAEEVAKRSTCKRLQVGAVVVKDNTLWYGYNGTGKGQDNCCEDADNVTKGNVIHAELNALLKATQPLSGATLYVTHSPCVQCAAALINVGIKTVYYKIKYRDESGINALDEAGIETIHYGS